MLLAPEPRSGEPVARIVATHLRIMTRPPPQDETPRSLRDLRVGSSGSSSMSEAEAGRPGSLNTAAGLGECVWLVVRRTC